MNHVVDFYGEAMSKINFNLKKKLFKTFKKNYHV